jgi:hypothetical protein
VEISEMDAVERCVSVLVLYCKSDGLQVCQEIPGDDQGASGGDLGNGVNGGIHVEEEDQRKTRTLQLGYY